MIKVLLPLRKIIISLHVFSDFHKFPGFEGDVHDFGAMADIDVPAIPRNK